MKKLHKVEDLEKIIKSIEKEYENCKICPQNCKVNRLKGEKGKCGVGKDSMIFNKVVLLEEDKKIFPSCAIYFAGCNLDCKFCSVREENKGKTLFLKINEENLKDLKKEIKHIKPKTISFIGGEPLVHLLTIFKIMKELNLNIPFVLFTNLYANGSVINIIKDWFKYFIVDFHFGNENCAREIASNNLKPLKYWKTVTSNLKLVKNKLILRHLLLPSHFDCCFKGIVKWIEKKIPQKDFYLIKNFYPFNGNFSNLKKEEIEKAYFYAKNKGLKVKILENFSNGKIKKDMPFMMQEVVIDGEGKVAFKFFDSFAREIWKNFGNLYESR